LKKGLRGVVDKKGETVGGGFSNGAKKHGGLVGWRAGLQWSYVW